MFRTKYKKKIKKEIENPKYDIRFEILENIEHFNKNLKNYKCYNDFC